jgi:hypothetical protein
MADVSNCNWCATVFRTDVGYVDIRDDKYSLCSSCFEWVGKEWAKKHDPPEHYEKVVEAIEAILRVGSH